MNQQNPQWGAQQPQQPGWAGQQTQPGYGYPQQPGWGAPPPQPPRKSPLGKILGFGCLGVVALVVLLAAIGAAVGGGDSDTSDKGTTATASSAPKDKVEKAPAAEEPAAEEPVPEAPVKITAKETAFAPSILADGSDYTSVKVTITNNSDDSISVNPLYFAVTDSKGTKHSSELAADENQIDTVDLAPGENVSGSITGKGKFTPEYVTYTDGLLGDPLRVEVS